MRLQTLAEARWIFAALVALLALSLAVFPWLAVVWLLLIGYTFYFFRDPDREPPVDPRAVLAAADGVVSDIQEIDEPEVVKTAMKRVGIFLSVFDVHTNRSPIEGAVIYCHKYAGKFLDARHPDATRLNEYQTWGIQNPRATVVVRQITGAIARRIVGWARVGQALKKGERFGMIRFGSRTEIYVPIESEIVVAPGDRVKGGLSVIALLP